MKTDCDFATVLERLPSKQREVLDLVADGFTSKEIARALGISPKTVDYRLSSARQLVGPVSRRELMRLHRELSQTALPEKAEFGANAIDHHRGGLIRATLTSGRFWLGFATGMSVGLTTYILTHVTLLVLFH